jgi:hypothetical protein
VGSRAWIIAINDFAIPEKSTKNLAELRPNTVDLLQSAEQSRAG